MSRTTLFILGIMLFLMVTLAFGSGLTIQKLYDCHDQWIESIGQVTNLDEFNAASQAEKDCILQAINPRVPLNSSWFLHDAGINPTGAQFVFNNTQGGTTGYIRVFNGVRLNGNYFQSATVTINGVQISGPSDFTSGADFCRSFTLLSGENTLTLTSSFQESGAMFVLVDDEDPCAYPD